MTAAQTGQRYLGRREEDFAGYAQYVSLTTEEIKLKTRQINQKADEMFTNTSERHYRCGTVIQDRQKKQNKNQLMVHKEAYVKPLQRWTILKRENYRNKKHFR